MLSNGLVLGDGRKQRRKKGGREKSKPCLLEKYLKKKGQKKVYGSLWKVIFLPIIGVAEWGGAKSAKTALEIGVGWKKKKMRKKCESTPLQPHQ